MAVDKNHLGEKNKEHAAQGDTVSHKILLENDKVGQTSDNIKVTHLEKAVPGAGAYLDRLRGGDITAPEPEAAQKLRDKVLTT